MATKEITIPYTPRKYQAQLHEKFSDYRYLVLVTHRRWGKTVWAVNQLIKDAMMVGSKTDRNPRFAYIAPQLKQAKSVAWDYFKEYAAVIPEVEFNEAELRIDFPTGARIQLLGADNPDQLRGIGLEGVVFDEYADIRPSIWPEIIRPTLTDSGGYAVFMGTPKGKDSFYQKYKDGKKKDDWLVEEHPVSETDIVPEAELQEIQQAVEEGRMEEAQYKQEWECSFVNSVRGSYYKKQVNYLRDEGRIDSVPYQASDPVHTAWDIGTGDATAIIFCQLIVDDVHIIDSYENNDEGIQHYANVLNQKPYSYNTHLGPWDLKKREFGSGQSILQTAMSHGITFQVVPKVGIADGIQAVRNTLPKCKIDEINCEDFIEAIEHYRKDYDEKRQVYKDKPLHDWSSHYADAMRYLSVGMNHLKQDNHWTTVGDPKTAKAEFDVFG